MRQVLLFIFSILVCCGGYAQADTISGSPVAGPQNTVVEYARLAVKTDLLPLIDVYNGGNVRVGLEYRFNETHGVSAEVGGLYYPLGNGMKNLKGFVGKGEYRYYYSKGADYYISAEYHIKKQSLDYGDTIKIEGLAPYWKEYSLSKLNHNANLKWGYQATEGRLVFDLYTGLGVRWKNTTCTGITEQELSNREHFDSMSLPETFKCGRGTYLTITFGFRVGLRLL